MNKTIRFGKWLIPAALGLAAAANAAALDTTLLSDITTSMDTAASWLSTTVTGAIIGLIVAGLIIAIVKYAGRKAKPGG